MGKGFDLKKLLIDVFAPQSGEQVLVMSDLPHGEWADSEKWAQRREMAAEWHAAFQLLGKNWGLGCILSSPILLPVLTAHPCPRKVRWAVSAFDGKRSYPKQT